MCLKNSYMFRNYDAVLHSGIVRMRKLQITKFNQENQPYLEHLRKRRFAFPYRDDAQPPLERRGGVDGTRGVACWILTALPWNRAKLALSPRCEYAYATRVRVWVCAVERVKVGGTKRCFPQGHPGRSRLTLASKRLRVPIKVTLCLA